MRDRKAIYFVLLLFLALLVFFALLLSSCKEKKCYTKMCFPGDGAMDIGGHIVRVRCVTIEIPCH